MNASGPRPSAPVRRLPLTRALPEAPDARASTPSSRLQTAGLWLRDHQRAVIWVQWSMVLAYAVLLIVPALLPLPEPSAQLWSSLTRFAQVVIWGIWWPGVLLSVLLFGRLWCGVFCPEGALTAFASRHGKGRAIPRWVRWPGWPFAAFVVTTAYGQMILVSRSPHAALLILGGSNLAAVLVGFLYGRDKRVWCRFLCPVTGVFGLLAKLAPMHYAVNAPAWDGCPPSRARLQRFTCEPMVPVRTMQSAAPCHMCGRCAGFRDAVTLAPRLPGSEVVRSGATAATGWESLLIIPGLLGVASAALQWSCSPWFLLLRQMMAARLSEAGLLWPFEATLPWWLLSNPSGVTEAPNVLHGLALLIYLLGVTAALSVLVALPLALATRLLGAWEWQRFHHLTQSLIPVAACGLILGLSAQTVTLLQTEGQAFSASGARGIALALAAAWSVALAWQITGQYRAARATRVGATAFAALSLLPPVGGWVLYFGAW